MKELSAVFSSSKKEWVVRLAIPMHPWGINSKNPYLIEIHDEDYDLAVYRAMQELNQFWDFVRVTV